MQYILGLTALKFFTWVGYFLVALLCLMIMIIIHELGHYTAGKIFGFKINEFAIGFGPAIFKKKNKKTDEVFSLRLLPLGGFCAFAGEDLEAVKEGDFNSKPAWQRVIVLFSGAFFNFVSAIIIIAIFFMAFGEFFPTVSKAHSFVDTQQEQVLQEGDVILKVDGKKTYALLEQFGKISKFLKDKDQAVLTVNRNGEIIDINVIKGKYTYEIEENGVQLEKEGYGLGISMGATQHKLGFFESLGHAFVFSFEVVGLIFRSLGQVFTGALKVNESMGGTVTAITSLAQLTQHGFSAVMYGVCVVSASLAVMNLLPIPALDGSRIVFCLIEMIRKKPIDRKKEAIIHTVGIIFLFALAIILDLMHFFM